MGGEGIMIDEQTTRVSLTDVLQPEHLANPYPLYARLRAEDPVYWDERWGSWVLTRYADVVAALHDPRLSAVHHGRSQDTSWLPEEWRASLGPVLQALGRLMLFVDPPDHTRLRGLVNKAFTPRVVENMRGQIMTLVDELLDAVRDRGQMDVIADFAYPLPAIVIAQMLGVPPEDRDRFRAWSDDFGTLLDDYGLTLENAARSLSGMAEFMAYFRPMIARRRRQPASDLLSALATAEERGDVLSEDELLANCVLLLGAGHGTTTHLIGNGLLALLCHPDQAARLRDDPAVAAGAVNELLRYDGPVQLTGRAATTDLEIGGRHIAAGQGVTTVLGAANHDPAQFPDPDVLDITRPESRHVAFGYGAHFCVGAPLARLEASIALPALLRCLPNLRLQTEAPEWEPSMVFRGLRSLPVAFD
jgi:cytochrome P450